MSAHITGARGAGSVGWVDPRPNWAEVIDYQKGLRSP
jgi:hypothetical protein